MADPNSFKRRLSLIALAGALTIGCQPTGSPSSSGSPAPSATGQASGTPGASTTSANPIDIVWTDQPFSGTVTAVAQDQGQFVAVGGAPGALSAWTSADGNAWVAHAVPSPTIAQLGIDPIFGDPPADPFMMGRMARFGDTLLSFGTFLGQLDYLRPVGWRTTDLMTWEFIESTNLFFTSGYLVIDLVAGDGELVALNHGFAVPTGGTWRWTPSTSWVQTTPTGTNYTESFVGIYDAAWVDEQFVAVGERHPLGSSAVSWVSPDGQSWQESPASPALAGGTMRSVAGAPAGGFVAVGDIAGHPTAWTSADGLTWTSIALPGGDAADVHGLVAFDGGLLAIGEAGSGMLTWTSPDGTVWQAGPLLAGTVLRHELWQGGGETLAVNRDTVALFVTQGAQTVLWLGQIQP